MSVLNASIEGGSLNTAVSQIAASAFQGFETQASQIASQQTAIGSRSPWKAAATAQEMHL